MQRVPHDRSPLGPAPLDGAPLAATRTGTHAYWLYKQAVQHACRLDPHILVRPKQWPSMLGWSLNILAGAALAFERRVDPSSRSGP